MHSGGALNFRGQAEVWEWAEDLTKIQWEKHCIYTRRHRVSES